MATIKLNAQNKILTKNGKVSCGCCRGGGGCCMYPAPAFGEGIYTSEDLPDEFDNAYLYIFNNAGIVSYSDGVLTLSKGEIPDFPSKPSNFLEGSTYYATTSVNKPGFGEKTLLIWIGIVPGKLPSGEDSYGWVSSVHVYEDPIEPSGVEGPTVSGPCLWQSGDTPLNPFEGNDWYSYENPTGFFRRDKFADTYTILDVGSGQTIIVNRKSLCLWEEDNGGTRLFYNFGGPPPYNQYGAEIPRLIAWYIKDTPNLGDEGVSLPFSQQAGYGLGRLNTPVGNYGNSANDNPNSQIVYTVS